MSFNTKKIIPYLIVIVPLSLILSVGFLISNFYIHKIADCLTVAKENALQAYIDEQNIEAELQLKQFTLLFEYTKAKIEPELKEELQREVLLAHNVARKIYNEYKESKSSKEIKQRIKDTLNGIAYNEKSQYIFGVFL